MAAMPLESSKEEFVGFIRRSCRHVPADVLEKLQNAAVTTAVRMKVLNAFRACCFLAKEGHGRLYDLVKQLAPPPPTADPHLLYANPLYEFKRSHPGLQLPTELESLLKKVNDKPRGGKTPVDFDLTDEEAAQVTFALSSKLVPAWLMEACAFLTFEENLDIRVQVVRLWISASELPLYVGCRMTFAELRKMAVPPVEPPDFALEEYLPSKVQIRMREKTLQAMHWCCTMGRSLHHPAPDELPDTCPELFKRYARLRYPVSITENGYPSHGRVAPDVELDEMEFEESMENDLFDHKCSETPRMYARLARLLYDKDV